MEYKPTRQLILEKYENSGDIENHMAKSHDQTVAILMDTETVSYQLLWRLV